MEIPSSFYYLVGSLILANIGTIGSIIVFGARAIWWLSKLDSRVEKTEKDTHAYHEKLREVKDDIKEVRRSNGI